MPTITVTPFEIPPTPTASGGPTSQGPLPRPRLPLTRRPNTERPVLTTAIPFVPRVGEGASVLNAPRWQLTSRADGALLATLGPMPMAPGEADDASWGTQTATYRYFGPEQAPTRTLVPPAGAGDDLPPLTVLGNHCLGPFNWTLTPFAARQPPHLFVADGAQEHRHDANLSVAQMLLDLYPPKAVYTQTGAYHLPDALGSACTPISTTLRAPASLVLLGPTQAPLTPLARASGSASSLPTGGDALQPEPWQGSRHWAGTGPLAFGLIVGLLTISSLLMGFWGYRRLRHGRRLPPPARAPVQPGPRVQRFLQAHPDAFVQPPQQQQPAIELVPMRRCATAHA